MAYQFVRVMRTNFDQAARQIVRAMQAEPQKVSRGRPFHEKPWQRRRREREQSIRRHQNASQFANLRVIVARKARGF